MSCRTIAVALAVVFAGSGSGQETGTPGEQALFEKLPVVEAAALHQQTLEEAPANVTVITAAEIRKYGYRTLAEALNSVRGFYITNDRMYEYVGVRGFSVPGDLNTRFLVMLNGHPLTDHVYSANNFFGQDFGLDMDLVERIEIIRGPTSALYGSNGIFANVNIVTKSPVDSNAWRVSTETGSFGEKKALVSASTYLGRGANLLVSASVFNNSGQDFYFPEFDHPATNNGWARGVDGERGYHTFANLIWRDWSFVGYFNSRVKQPPIAPDDLARFDDRGTHFQDRRGLVGLTYEHQLNGNSQLRWQLFFNQFACDHRVDYGVPGFVEDVRILARNDWLDSQLTYTFPTGSSASLTVGVEGSFDFRNQQRNFVQSPFNMPLLSVDTPGRAAAVFAQEEWKLSRKWKVYGGLRFDATRYFASNVSPRIALVYEQDPKTVWKFVYGRPFRNPSAFEQFFQGLVLAPAAKLRPETANTFEASVERKFGSSWSATLAAYHEQLDDLIAVYTPNGLPPARYQNVGSTSGTGIEAEIGGKLRKLVEVSASVSFQSSGTGADGKSLSNSPQQVHKGRIGVPAFGGKVFLSGAVSYVSDRLTLAGASVGSALITDFTATTLRLNPLFDIQVGIRNAFNDRYYDPVGLAIGEMIEDGRSAYVKLVWHAKE